jgi:hypothetical protein
MWSLQQLWYFLTVFILTHPVNFLSLWQCERKPENTKKTHDFRQSVDWLFSHAWSVLFICSLSFASYTNNKINKLGHYSRLYVYIILLISK